MIGIGEVIARAHARYQRAAHDEAARLLPSVIRGSLLLLLAIMAARHDDGPVARQRLPEAARLAHVDRNHLWTAFGPTNAAIHELGVRVALGDTTTVVRIATDRLPPQLRGRRAQIHLELATAAAGRRDDNLAVLHLLEAERVARQALAHDASARLLVGELLARGRATPGLRALASRTGVVT